MRATTTRRSRNSVRAASHGIDSETRHNTPDKGDENRAPLNEKSEQIQRSTARSERRRSNQLLRPQCERGRRVTNKRQTELTEQGAGERAQTCTASGVLNRRRCASRQPPRPGRPSTLAWVSSITSGFDRTRLGANRFARSRGSAAWTCRMLNVGKLAAGPGAGRYYVDRVAQGREDYYSGEGEAPGEWMGGGAALLGLAGEVTRRASPAAGGARPGHGRAAGRAFRTGGRGLRSDVPGAEEREHPVRHRRSGGDAGARRGARRGGRRGAGEHRARGVPRAPRRGRRGRRRRRLHRRGVPASRVARRRSAAAHPRRRRRTRRAPDGRWTALHGQLLYRHAKTAGYLYQAVLRAELTERLQVGGARSSAGRADIAGVPREVIEHFSQRRAEVLAHMAARGEHSARAAQVAALETRRRKEYDVPVERLREEWRARAAEHGLDRFRLRRVLGSRRAGSAPTRSRRAAGATA